MKRMQMNRPVLWLCAIAAASSVNALSGCSQAPEPTTVEEPAGYATADELLAAINAEFAKPVLQRRTMAHWQSSYYLENDLQRRLFQVELDFEPWARFCAAVVDRFGNGFAVADSIVERMHPSNAEIVERSDRRVRAVSSLVHDESIDIYLVEVGGRWYMSGYTLERILDDVQDKNWAVNQLEATVRALTRITDQLTQRLDAGQFTSLEEIESAWNSMMDQR